MIDVFCIGHAAYDINMQLPFFPPENSKMEIDDLIKEGGGPAANEAFLLSKWGVNSAFAGLVGDDIYGQRIRQEFKEIGTDITFLTLRPDYQTPLSIVQVNCQTGSRTIINRKVPGGILELNPDDLLKINPKVLLFDGHQPQASLFAIKMFPQALTVLDAGSLRQGTEMLAGVVDYLICSERFALSVSGLPNLKNKHDYQECLDCLKKLNNKGRIVVTLGELGLIYDNQGRLAYLPAYKTKVVDTTGAGDIFHGAFVYGILNNLFYEDALKLAAMAASLSVACRGGRHSIPELSLVKKALFSI